MSKHIGFIGIGIMGYHLARHLIEKGNFLHIINRNSYKTKKFLKLFKNSKRLSVYNHLDELANNCDIIISCVGNDKNLKEIYLSNEGIISGINNKTIVIDHTTSSAKISTKLYSKFLEKNSYFFDAPMSGGEVGAKNGSLSLMVGGNKFYFNQIKSTLQLYSKSLIYMGKSGSGQLAKMVNQICVATVIQGLAEGLNFAKKKRINIDNLVEVISNGAAQSWQLENRAKTMCKNKFNFGFMNKLMLKDLNLIFDEIKGTNIELPITKRIKTKYKDLIKLGYENEDTSNLIRLLR